MRRRYDRAADAADGSPEDVVAVVRPHWWALVGPCLLVAVALGATLALLGAEPPEAVLLAAGAVLVLAAVRLVVRYARWGSTRLVVTTTRLFHRRGVLGRRVREIRLAAVTSVDVRQTLRQRVLRAGDLELGVAGDVAPLVVPDVPHVRAVAAEVDRLLALAPPWSPPRSREDLTTVWPRR